MNTVTVVLNVAEMTASELINQARFYVQKIAANAASFPNATPTAAKVTTAADELELADEDATDGGKSKTRLKNDKIKNLRSLLVILSHNVQQDAGGDETIVHLAGMEVKKFATRNIADFKAMQGDNPGTVKLNVKARPKTMYKWQYSNDPAQASWTDAGISSGCKKVISNLASGLYWFRVIFMDNDGEHNGEAIRFAVN